MDLDAVADLVQQHYREPAAEMLLELRQTMQQAAGIVGLIEERVRLRYVQCVSEVRQQRDDAPPILLRQYAGEVRIGRIQRDADGHRFAMPQCESSDLLQFVRGPVTEIERP